MLTYLKVPLSWRQILRRTFNEAFFEDNCLGMAAQLAYYFFFALFPALLVLISLASTLPLDGLAFGDTGQAPLGVRLIDEMFRLLGGFAPPEIITIVTDQLRKMKLNQPGGLLTFGVLAALWSSSAAMTAIIDTLNSAYDVEEGRPWWQVRLTAVALTMGGAFFILISFALIVFGPSLAEYLADWLYLGSAFEWTWKILHWPFVFALASVGIALVYYFAPDVEQDWIWLTPGSVFATTLWLLATLGFKYYVANLGSYTETYGALGAVMVLMLWFYMSGLVILIGAEMNAEIEHASPYGKDEGEKVPGQKRKIGPAAMRAWIRRRRSRGEPAPSAEEVKNAVGPPPASKEPGTPLASSTEKRLAREKGL
jgi:membrane protein